MCQTGTCDRKQSFVSFSGGLNRRSCSTQIDHRVTAEERLSSLVTVEGDGDDGDDDDGNDDDQFLLLQHQIKT